MVIELDPENKNSDEANLTGVQRDLQTEWHRKMGHLGIDNLKKL